MFFRIVVMVVAALGGLLGFYFDALPRKTNRNIARIVLFLTVGSTVVSHFTGIEVYGTPEDILVVLVSIYGIAVLVSLLLDFKEN